MTGTPADPPGAVEELVSHPFFEGMSPRQVRLVAAQAARRRFAPGDTLMRVGDPEPGAYLVVAGRLALEVAQPGRGATVVETFQPGEVVGWSWLVFPHRATFDVVALDPTTVYHLDSRGTRELCEQDHDLGFLVARRLLAVVSERLAATRVRLLDVFADAH